MELIDRYLQAVRFWLPRNQGQDILAELSEDLRSEIEAREAELGRRLDEAEVAAILKRLGRPVFVANRYVRQQWLIGPLLFPIYRFVLKVVALCYVIPVLLVSIALITLDPGYRAAHGSTDWIDAVGSAWGRFWIATFFAFGVVTIVFAVIERVHAKSGFLEEWNPQKLPAFRDPNRISRAASVVELVANIVFCVWWIGLRSPAIHFPSAVQITLAPVWPYFFWCFLLLGIANTAAAGFKLFRPYWTSFQALFRLLADAAGAALFCWLCKSEIVSGLNIAGVASEKAADIANAINLWMSRSLPFVLIAGVVVVAIDIYRLMRAKSNNGALTPGAATGGFPTSVLF